MPVAIDLAKLDVLELVKLSGRVDARLKQARKLALRKRFEEEAAALGFTLEEVVSAEIEATPVRRERRDRKR